jgi:hypothetical protein
MAGFFTFAVPKEVLYSRKWEIKYFARSEGKIVNTKKVRSWQKKSLVM